MPRNLDTTMAAELAKGGVRPFYLGELNFASGVQRVWSGVGPITWNGKTFSGLGELVSVGAIAESSDVRANGTTVGLNVLPSQIAIPPLGFTPPDPPRATAAGESVVWALAPVGGVTPQTTMGPYGPSIWTGGQVMILTWSPGAVLPRDVIVGGTLSMTTGAPIFVPNRISASFSYFIAPEIPPGAVITGVYPMQVSSGDGTISASNAGGAVGFGSNIGSLNGLTVTATLANTVEGAPPSSFSVSFVGAAIYFKGSPLTNEGLLHEAMADVRVGAAAKIWFGFLSSTGAIVGAPFPVFSGLIDEPSIDEDPTGTRIVLALENRLRNLQRASQKRYTAADQKLSYPNDSGLNWVELLNELSELWGA